MSRNVYLYELVSNYHYLVMQWGTGWYEYYLKYFNQNFVYTLATSMFSLYFEYFEYFLRSQNTKHDGILPQNNYGRGWGGGGGANPETPWKKFLADDEDAYPQGQGGGTFL